MTVFYRPERSRERLQELLDQALRSPADREAAIRTIHEEFTQVRAVLVGDLDSFTASTMEHGITSFLVLLHKVHELARPVVRQHEGLMLRSQADTLFCLFGKVEHAAAAARAFHGQLREGLDHQLGGTPVTMAIGIGYGPLLNIADEDALGAEVNLAYKLGEDIGRPGETLLTPAARKELSGSAYRFDERRARLSKLDLSYFALL